MEDRQDRATGDLLDRATKRCAACRSRRGRRRRAVRRALDAGLEVHVVPLSAKKLANGQRIRRIVRIAVAASILAAVGGLRLLGRDEGSSNIAFANVAYVLEHLQSATFDMTMEMTGQDRRVTMRAKGSFLAPVAAAHRGRPKRRQLRRHGHYRGLRNGQGHCAAAHAENGFRRRQREDQGANQ